MSKKIEITEEIFRAAYAEAVSREDDTTTVEEKLVRRFFGPKEPREWFVEVHSVPTMSVISSPGICADKYRGRVVDHIRVREVFDNGEFEGLSRA